MLYILSSNSLETEGDFPHGHMSSIFMERPMCFTPKDDKYHLWSILPSDEVALPPSKQIHRAQEAMSACVAEAATSLVEPVETGVTCTFTWPFTLMTSPKGGIIIIN